MVNKPWSQGIIFWRGVCQGGGIGWLAINWRCFYLKCDFSQEGFAWKKKVRTLQPKLPIVLQMRCLDGTPPKFNIASEKWWLEAYFPIGKATFQGLC